MRLPVQSKTPTASLIYDLRAGEPTSDVCYAATARFADDLLAAIEKRAGKTLTGYSRFVCKRLSEAPRSRGEYAIEFLTLGMALRRYEPAARAISPWIVWSAGLLLWLRRRIRVLRFPVDAARAVLHRLAFAPAIARPRSTRPSGTPLDRLTRLTAWLHATGEFEQEALRLDRWRRYLGTLTSEASLQCLRTALALFDAFAADSAQRLGPFTRGVEPFLSGPYTRRGCREDQLFCGRAPVEYHLAMVAAEVMNRGLRPRFDATRNRVLLVPSCMRGVRASRCRAHVHGVDITCTACDPECAVHRLTRRMREQGAQVYLVPHATGFSRWLHRWEHTSDTGVTAVACLLNILPGGYEMRARDIPSQCVPLDYPGCRKHWSSKGIPTAVNEDRLVQIVSHARVA